MKRANTFVVEAHPLLWELADNCARLWNVLNFERRQTCIRYREFEWYLKHLYRKYAPLIGLAEIVVINKEERSLQEELVGDLITIISHFAGKLYGMRSHKYKKVVEGARKLVQDC